MIKIQEHLNRGDADIFLNKLAKEHWLALNPRLKNNSGYTSNSLIEKCKKFYIASSTPLYIKKYANSDNSIAARHKKFFLLLKKDRFKFLKKLITGRLDDFTAIQVEIFKILNPNDLFTTKGRKINQTLFGKLISEELLNYKYFRGSDNCKNLFLNLGFKSATCPYCNYNKLDITTISKKNKAYLDLDHFYPKSLNPFFALSFFNLIPSCHSCNSSDKSDIPFSIQTQINPYYESFEDIYKFKISLVKLLGNSMDNIEIQNISKPLDTSCNDFNLVRKYNNNIASAENLIDLFLKYNKQYIGTSNENSFIELIMKDIPVNRRDILKFPKAKLNRDILQQIDINNVLGII
ncbi:HNH endonuclease domain-containing protein [Flavobacterium sp. 245]|uniref:HNH endonuclease domain-containing protein n=1 Tax=Flavobacterium sp. 245 TaxID=2512115 RepID=UPI0010603B09|nr:HNH endonuclease domain-containing protein [Flavobacterium sp. 245]TDP02195.1 HNH endonuclease [Flavobacterium sp. 245]